MSNKTKLPGKHLTVIIRDYSPLIHMQEPVSLRTVRIELTEDQRRQLALRWTHSSCAGDGYEEVSQAILESEGGDEG